ncbi:MAG: baseplate J/gp47 family protein [Acidimicrobiales bacterium]
MSDLPPTCAAVERPQLLFDPATTVHGLRAARATVIGPQRFVDVSFYQAPPSGVDDPDLWTLVPAPGVADVGIGAATIVGDQVRLRIEGLPDPTRYRLEITPPAGVDFDPLRTRIPVRLRPECPDLGNCFETPNQPPPVSQSPVRDYTARDWLGLRQELLEFHLRNQPDADTSLADPTIASLELFAHIGDVLHYRLDRVATEGYLSTARQRASVRRHARLLDYQLGDAVAARTTIHLSVPPGAGSASVTAGDIVRPSEEQALAFTLEQDRTIHDSLGEIALYDWGEDGCCLNETATSAVLVRPRPADPLGADWLRVGDKIVFEVIDPGDPIHHDAWRTRDAATPWPAIESPSGPLDGFREPLPSRRAQVVELTSVESIVDPLAPDLSLALVRWANADALERSYPVSIDTRPGAPEVTVARANLVDAHHGLLVDGPGEQVLEELEPDWAPNLPIEERQNNTRLGWLLTGAPQGLARQRDGTPYRLQVSVDLPSSGPVAAEYVGTHLGVPPGLLSVTVEEESWRPPLLRFTTGSLGTEPPTDAVIEAVYEAGGGARANLPANTLTALERNASLPGQPPSWTSVAGVSARNPVPAWGGADPEPLARARRGAPQAFAAFPQRAVLPVDHAEAARQLDGIDRATASRDWTGAWPLIRTVVDSTGTDVDADLATAVAHLDGLRMLGQEVTVVSGTGVALAIGLDVCVAPGIDTEAVRQQILAKLRPGSVESPGFFHPLNLKLGGTIHTSSVIAVVAGIHGVDAVQLTMARRLAEPVETIHEVLTFERSEIPVLDDDVARPDRGRLELMMRGGR